MERNGSVNQYRKDLNGRGSYPSAATDLVT